MPMRPGSGGYIHRMGLGEWLEKQSIAAFLRVSLYRDRIEHKGETHRLDGVSARVEDGSELESRVTMTRMAALGLFAFAVKKKRGGEKYLTIEGPDFFWTLEVDRDEQGDARKFAAKINNAARALD